LHPSTTDRLTERAYWDDYHVAGQAANPRAPSTEPVVSAPAGRGLKSRIKRVLGTRLLERFRNYEDFLLWDVILPQHLSDREGSKVVEIGSAPGHRLVRLKQRFGLTPYGIDYSRVGADLNRHVFSDHGIDPRNVMEVDFVAGELPDRYRETFDVVLSGGFIEHFTDVRAIIRKHLQLLKPGGCLVVQIPNLRGINFLLSWLFCRDVIPLHNLDIMKRKNFAALFDAQGLAPLFCGYSGTFNFYMFQTPDGSWMRVPLVVCHKIQPVLNLVFRSVFRDRGAENGWFSPSLVYVGIKR
jgi:SAM-dependent methyltransferase